MSLQKLNELGETVVKMDQQIYKLQSKRINKLMDIYRIVESLEGMSTTEAITTLGVSLSNLVAIKIGGRTGHNLHTNYCRITLWVENGIVKEVDMDQQVWRTDEPQRI